MKSNKKAASGSDEPKKKKKKKSSPYAQFALAVMKTVFVILISLGCVVGGILGGAVLGYIRTSTPITPDQLELTKLTSFIYDKDNNEIAQIKGGENRVLVDHSEIPDNMRNAFIAIEDSRFKSHNGVDTRRFVKAAFSYIATFGNASFGGSTITQQLVKNITGNTDSTIKRKVQEAWQAMDLEKKMSKDQILDNYMNRINTGLGCWGVQAAAKKFFNKDVKNLSLAECASIAGVTKSPGTYDPTLSDKTRAANKERQEVILSEMLKQGYITQNEYNEAIAEKLKFYEGSDEEIQTANKVQSYFVDYVLTQVKKDLMKKYNLSSDAASIKLYNGGLKIYTTQDSNVQKIMNEEFTNPKNFPANDKISNPDMQAQAAMLILDPATGQIRGMYGAYGEKTGNFTLNRATDMKRQPGSTFKPIAVYGPGIDLGVITPATVVDDVPVFLDKSKPTTLYPRNVESGVYEGLLTIRRAVQKSQNVVAAQVWLNLLGADNSIKYLKKVNIDRPKEKYLSMALGGLEEGVNPLLMAAAYVPFDNKGVYLEPISYTKVTDDNGNVLLDKKADQKRNIAYKETTAYLMTSMLKDVVSGGTANGYGVKNSAGKAIPTAGKTGTTDDFVDKWFVGYTPYYVGATWYGYNYNKTLKKPEYSQALKIWNKVMNRVHAKLDPKEFPQPQGLVKKTICIYSGKLVGPYCSRDPRGNAVRTEYFAKGTEPTDTCDVHVLAKVDITSKDIFGRPLLANPYCPPGVVQERVFIKRPVPYLPKNNIGGSLAATIKDWIYQLPEGEYCTKHSATTPKVPDLTNPIVSGGNNNTGPGNSQTDDILPNNGNEGNSSNSTDDEQNLNIDDVLP
jgi:penicillin-binding protein 1A